MAQLYQESFIMDSISILVSVLKYFKYLRLNEQTNMLQAGMLKEPPPSAVPDPGPGASPGRTRRLWASSRCLGGLSYPSPRPPIPPAVSTQVGRAHACGAGHRVLPLHALHVPLVLHDHRHAVLRLLNRGLHEHDRRRVDAHAGTPPTHCAPGPAPGMQPPHAPLRPLVPRHAWGDSQMAIIVLTPMLTPTLLDGARRRRYVRGPARRRWEHMGRALLLHLHHLHLGITS